MDDKVENSGFSEGTGAALKNIKCPYVHTTHLICNIWAAKVALSNPLNSEHTLGILKNFELFCSTAEPHQNFRKVQIFDDGS